jgi:hypothetical protein
LEEFDPAGRLLLFLWVARGAIALRGWLIMEAASPVVIREPPFPRRFWRLLRIAISLLS